MSKKIHIINLENNPKWYSQFYSESLSFSIWLEKHASDYFTMSDYLDITEMMFNYRYLIEDRYYL